MRSMSVLFISTLQAQASKLGKFTGHKFLLGSLWVYARSFKETSKKRWEVGFGHGSVRLYSNLKSNEYI